MKANIPTLMMLASLAACAPSGVESASTAAAPAWRVSGSPLLRPTEIRDDGQHIYLTFSDEQELPAVFGLTRSGEETLVNGHMRSGVYVIDEIYPTLVLRLGRHVARATKQGS